MAQQRRLFLINRPFQFRFAFYVCSWLTALGIAYPLMITNLFDYLIQYLSLDVTGPALADLEQTRQNLVRLIILMQIVIVSITFLISLFISHRIAGPLYKLRKYFQQIQGGQWGEKLTFRKSDYFQELADEFNHMVYYLRQKFDSDRLKLNQVKMELEKLSQQPNPDYKNTLSLILKNLNR